MPLTRAATTEDEGMIANILPPFLTLLTFKLLSLFNTL